MSTHSYLSEMRRGICQFAFSILCALLFVSQLVFPSVAFALSAQKDSRADPPPALARSEVSVVRLVSNYTVKTASSTTTSQANALLCTSLGVLVKSWPARSPADFNSWVLTGASLLTTTPPSCASASSTGKPASYTLSTINVYANNVYTGNLAANALLGTYRSPNPVTCTVPRCLSGA